MLGPVQQAQPHGEKRSRRVPHFGVIADAAVIEHIHGKNTHRVSWAGDGKCGAPSNRRTHTSRSVAEEFHTSQLSPSPK